MLKKLATATAMTGLMLASAAAQSPSTSPGSMSPPAAQTETKSTTTTTTSSSANFIPAQKSGQWLASKFKGSDVMGADNQKIGDVSDILFERDGSKINAYVVGVGGFLGIGAKEVALAPSEFQVVPGDNGAAPKLKVGMTKEQLQEAPNFVPYKEPASTASTSTSSGTAPSTMGTPRPSSEPAGTPR
jgi:sporulation protein YlmC with PRC-barrel domain